MWRIEFIECNCGEFGCREGNVGKFSLILTEGNNNITISHLSKEDLTNLKKELDGTIKNAV